MSDLWKKTLIFDDDATEAIRFITRDISQGAVPKATEHTLFETNISCMMFAALYGVLNNERRVMEKPTSKGAKIDYQQLIPYETKLNFVLQTVLLMHNEENETNENKLDRAFRYPDKHFNLFLEYVCGGLKKLREECDDLDENSSSTYFTIVKQLIDDSEEDYDIVLV